MILLIRPSFARQCKSQKYVYLCIFQLIIFINSFHIYESSQNLEYTQLVFRQMIYRYVIQQFVIKLALSSSSATRLFRLLYAVRCVVLLMHINTSFMERILKVSISFLSFSIYLQNFRFHTMYSNRMYFTEEKSLNTQRRLHHVLEKFSGSMFANGRAVLQLFIEVDLFYIFKITIMFKKRLSRSFIFNHCFILENHVNTEKIMKINDNK